MKLNALQSAPHERTQFDIPIAALALIAPLYSTRAHFSEDHVLQHDVSWRQRGSRTQNACHSSIIVLAVFTSTAGKSKRGNANHDGA